MPASVRSQVVQTNAASGFTVNKPTGAVAGDYLLLIATEDTAGTRVNAKTGWTQPTGAGLDVAGHVVEGTSAVTAIQYRKLDASDASVTSYSWTTTATWTGVVALLCIQDADDTTGLDVIAGSEQLTSSSTFTTATITPSVDNCLIIGFWSVDHNATGASWTPPGTMTELFDQEQSSAFMVGMAAYEVLATAAAISRTATFSASNNGSATIMAWRPAAGAATKAPPFRQQTWRRFSQGF